VRAALTRARSTDIVARRRSATKFLILREALMSEAQLPPEGAFDARESSIVATPVTPTGHAKQGHKRLATLAGSFLLLIAVCGYFYWSMVHDQNTTARIQKELKEDGVQVIYSQAEPKEASFSPFQSLTPTVKIVAPAGNITNELLVRIREINQDMGLMLNNCPITDEGLVSLEGKHNLRWLELRRTKITDEGLKHLRGTDLELLDLSTTKIGDAGLANLGDLDLPNLKTLALEQLKNVTDEGISHLARFKSLEFLSVAGTKVTPAGMRHLKKKLPELTILGGS
jgi:hypothetical protein